MNGGFQTAIGENTWGGLGVSLEGSDTLVNGTAKTDGTWWQVGVVVKWTHGPWKLSVSASGGQGDIDTDRRIGLLPAAVIAKSSTDVGLLTSLARLAYSFGATGVYVTPMIELGESYVNIDGYTETGAGPLGLAIAASDEWIVSGGPAIEIGSTIVTDALTYRPYVKAGVKFYSEDGFSSPANFIGSPGTAFTTTSKFDDVFAEVAAGIQMFSPGGINLRLNYDGRFGENSEQHGGDAKLTVNY